MKYDQPPPLIRYLNQTVLMTATMPNPPDTIGSPGRQQQREPSVCGDEPVTVGRIVHGEGVEIECEQEYGCELFHVVMIMSVQRREKRKGEKFKKIFCGSLFLLSLCSNSTGLLPGGAFLGVVCFD